MKDTLKQLLVDCLNASKKGGSGGGVDPSKFPSQVVILKYVVSKRSTPCAIKTFKRSNLFYQFASLPLPV